MRDERRTEGAERFERRVVLAVVDALAHTLPYWVRGVAVRPDAGRGSVEVLFASAERWGDVDDGIAAFSERLRASTGDWLRHTTDQWFGPGLDGWPGLDARVVVATRVPPAGEGMDPLGEFENAALVTIAGCMSNCFGPTLWGAAFDTDVRERVVDLHLAFAGEPDRVDRHELDELVTLLDSQSLHTVWRIHVWVGDRADLDRWPGCRLRRVHLQRRRDAVAPDR